VDRLVDQRRWRDPLSIGSVIAAWPRVAGAEVAAHCVPERVEDGVLVVRADSTAWATQLRLLASTLVARLNEELRPGAQGSGAQGSGGPGAGGQGAGGGAAGGAITSVTVLGPAAPSWKKGPRSVPGRGPRDTYG
jgi:predicted nucleic acid-binding Zn ribbon protein